MPDQDVFHYLAAAGDFAAEAGSTVYGAQRWACRIDGPITATRAQRYGFDPAAYADEIAASAADAGYIIRMNGRTAVRVVERFRTEDALRAAWAQTVRDLGEAPHAP